MIPMEGFEGSGVWTLKAFTFEVPVIILISHQNHDDFSQMFQPTRITEPMPFKVMSPFKFTIRNPFCTQKLQTALGPSKPRDLRPQTPPYEIIRDPRPLHMRVYERLG